MLIPILWSVFQSRPVVDDNIEAIRQLCPELAEEIEDKSPPCEVCKDDPRRKCKECACTICGGKDSASKCVTIDYQT